MPTIDTQANPTTPWYKRFWNWITTVGKRLFSLALDGVKREIVDFINNEDVQDCAKDGVVAAIQAGLRGDDAWDAAMEVFKERLEASGIACGEQNLLDTVLQVVYTTIKNRVNAA